MGRSFRGRCPSSIPREDKTDFFVLKTISPPRAVSSNSHILLFQITFHQCSRGRRNLFFQESYFPVFPKLFPQELCMAIPHPDFTLAFPEVSLPLNGDLWPPTPAPWPGSLALFIFLPVFRERQEDEGREGNRLAGVHSLRKAVWLNTSCLSVCCASCHRATGCWTSGEGIQHCCIITGWIVGYYIYT